MKSKILILFSLIVVVTACKKNKEITFDNGIGDGYIKVSKPLNNSVFNFGDTLTFSAFFEEGTVNNTAI
jgi:hypothetical protein